MDQTNAGEKHNFPMKKRERSVCDIIEIVTTRGSWGRWGDSDKVI